MELVQQMAPLQVNELNFIGEVQDIRFEDPRSLFKILKVKIIDGDFEWPEPDIIVRGRFGEVKYFTKYEFTGRLTRHPRFGDQMELTKYRTVTPKTTEGIITYLSSDLFPGIGSKTAEKVVEALGDQAIDQLLHKQLSAKELGISKKQLSTMQDVLKANQGTEHIIIGLNDYGFSSALANRIFQKYQQETLTVIKENPYQLALDIRGISFQRADQIAQQLGIPADSPLRLQASIIQSLEDVASQGDIYALIDDVINGALVELQKNPTPHLTRELLAEQLPVLVEEHKIVIEDGKVYLARYNHQEREVAHIIADLLAESGEDLSSEITDLLDAMQEELGITYGEQQVAALKAALNSPIFLLTGGPGTGKTTIIKGIVALFSELNDLDLEEEANLSLGAGAIALAAPTGRAAKRMSEATGLPAGTLHRLLKINFENQSHFEPEDLHAKLLIVDESSMIDLPLLHKLMQCVTPATKVIFVGDADQLPSVGPGQIFSDLLASGVIPHVKLDRIYRQDANSTITDLAAHIQKGQLPADFTQKQADRSFMPCSYYQVQTLLERIVNIALKKGIPAKDIQVLIPMHKGEAGTNQLNPLMQNLLNPQQGQLQAQVNQQIFRVGDRVLNLLNMPEKEVFNGDIGEIVDLVFTAKDANGQRKLKTIKAKFDNREVDFSPQEWKNLTLAYCMTIHKSQGTEFPVVIIPMLFAYQVMLKRNLLYTGITRAKEKLILLGEFNAFVKCVQELGLTRKTTLKERLLGACTDEITQEPSSYLLTKELIMSKAIDPLIGMEGIVLGTKKAD